MANKVLQLLRNESPFSTRELALDDIQTQAENLVDGEMWLTSYTDREEVKTILSVKRDGGVEIFDNKNITDAINALDVTNNSEPFEYILKVDQVNGKVQITKGYLSNGVNINNPIYNQYQGGTITYYLRYDGDTIKLNQQGYLYADITAEDVTVDNGDGTTSQLDDVIDGIETSISNIEGDISDTIQNNLKSYTIIEKTESLPTNVAHRYKLQQTVGTGAHATVTEVGENIDIPKDSSLKEVYLGANTDTIDASTGVITKNTVTDPQSMNFAYQLADGTYSLTKIDISKFLTESEFGNGFEVSNAGVVSIKLDSTGENFLTVGQDGVKLDGVQDAISDAISDALDTGGAIDSAISGAIEELDNTVRGNLDSNDEITTGHKVGIKVVEEDGVLTSVTVVEDDIASAARVEEIERVTAEALNDLEMRKITLEDLPNFVTNVNGGNGISVSENGQSQTVSVDLDSDSTNALSFNGGKLYCSNNPSINCGTY